MSKPNAVTATVVPYTTPPPFLRGAPVRELRVLLAQEARRRLGLGGFQMPASHARGRGFESRRSRQFPSMAYEWCSHFSLPAIPPTQITGYRLMRRDVH